MIPAQSAAGRLASVGGAFVIGGIFLIATLMAVPT